MVVLRRIRTIARALISAEEEQLVLDDPAAGGAAELVPLQGVARGCEEVARVQIAVAEIVEEIAVKLVRAGLGDGVDRGAGVDSEARGYGAGLHAELLQRVREGNGMLTFDMASVLSPPSRRYAVPLPCPPATEIRVEL